jgi:hypothetical protein
MDMKKYLNNKYLNIMVAGLALSAGLYSVSSAEEAQKAMEGEITVGGTAMIEDLDDANITPESQRNRSSASSFSAGQAPGAKGAAEYMDIADEDVSPFTKADLNYRAEGVSLDFFGRFETSDDQEYALKGAINRVFLFETDYSEFTHRLDHDYLENLNAHIFVADTANDPRSLPFLVDIPADAAGYARNPGYNALFPDPSPGVVPIKNNNPRSTLGAANVYNTDWNEAARYYANRSEWNNSMKFNIPSLPGLKIGFDHRLEKREGCKQAMTMSKCSGCHIESYSKNLDETTNDYVPKVSFQAGALSVEYSYLHREFDDDSQETMYDALGNPHGYNTLAEDHAGTPNFDALLQFPDYNANTGTNLLFNRMPDSTKDSNNMRMRYDIDDHNVITGGIVYSKIANTSTDGGVPGSFAYQNLGLYGDDLELESTALMAKWNSRLSHALNLTVHGKYQTLSNDDVVIDVNDQATVDRYGFPDDYYNYTRLSGYDLDILSTGFDMVWKAMHGVTVSGGYEFHQEERQNYDAHGVPETTDEHTFKLKGDWRVNSKVKLGLGYKLELIDDPYALEKAMSLEDDNFGLPTVAASYHGSPADVANYGYTYFPNIYDARTDTRSNQPESVNELSFKANLTPMQTLATNFYSKYRYAENSDLGGSDWQQDLFNLGLNVVATPTQKFTVTAGYDYFYDTIDSMYCVAIYDG